MSHSLYFSAQEVIVRMLVLKHHPPEPHPIGRAMAPGGGLIIAAAISVLFWAAIAGIIALI